MTPLAQPLLFALQLLSLLVHNGLPVSGRIEISESPLSQVVPLGSIAEFYCAASGDGFKCDIAHSSYSIQFPIPGYFNEPEYGITVTIDKEDDNFMADITIEGRLDNNSTNVSCLVWSADISSFRASDIATLTIIGTPSTPVAALVNIDMEAKYFSAVWDVPFSHKNYSISHYNVTVWNKNQSVGYVESFPVSPETGPPLPTSGPVTVTLPFPPHTTSCDILNISVTAVNDIGPSRPTYFRVLVPKLPDSDVNLTTKVLFQSDGSPVVVIEMKFPEFCWFERVNYSVLLEERGGEGRQLVLIEGAVNNPQELVVETISAGLACNANYSVVVSAQTDLWNSSTSPHTFSTHFTPTSSSVNVSTVIPAHLLAGVVSGVTVFIIFLVVSIVSIILVLRSRTKGGHSNVLRVSSVAHNLTPNPIYGDPLYETISDAAAPKSPRLKAKPPTLPPPPLPPSSSLSSARGEPKYTDSPTVGQFKLPQVLEYEEPKGCKKDTEEDYYIQMHTGIRH